MAFWELREMIQLVRTCEVKEIKSTLIKTSITHDAREVEWSLGASFLEINKTFQGSYFITSRMLVGLSSRASLKLPIT